MSGPSLVVTETGWTPDAETSISNKTTQFAVVEPAEISDDVVINRDVGIMAPERKKTAAELVAKVSRLQAKNAASKRQFRR